MDANIFFKTNPKVILKDGNDQEVKTVKTFTKGDSVMGFEIALSVDQPGGFYRVEFHNAMYSLVQRQTIYILNFTAPTELLLLELNRDVVSAGDSIIAEVSFKVLGRQTFSKSLDILHINGVLTNNKGELIQNIHKNTDTNG